MRKQNQNKERPIVIAEDNRARLAALIHRAIDLGQEMPTHMALAAELRRAQVVPRSQLPHDVVAMNSTVRLRDLEDGDVETYTLVYPQDADISVGRLSILAPVGTALLGYRVGDIVEWPVPAGVTRFRIEEVLTPTRSSRVPVAH